MSATTHGHLLPQGYLHTQGTQILDENNTPVKLAGVNWYGFECTSKVAGGLDYQTPDDLCQLIVQMGFNTVRLPFCEEVIQTNPPIHDYLDMNDNLQGKTALEIMDVVINAAGAHGLKVILDSHRCEAGWSAQGNGLWYTQQYPESAWLATWTAIVTRYANNQTVIGCDLRNQPGSPPLQPNDWPQNGGALWGYGDQGAPPGQPRDLAAASERAGNAILGINPNLLIFVEGARSDPAGPIFNGANQLYWAGGNLMGVGHAGGPRTAPVPISLNVSNRLVYSVHDYGPDMYGGLAWCQLHGTATNANACNTVWDQTWGYIVKEGIAPIWIGEFGTPNGYKPGDMNDPTNYTTPNNTDAQGAWFTYLVEYIGNNAIHWCYWALNGVQSYVPDPNPSKPVIRDPSVPDHYGVLDPSWATPASDSMIAKLQSIQ